MYSPYMMPKRPALPADYYDTDADKRRRYIDSRVEEIFANPIELAKSFAQYIEIKPTQCGQVLKNASSTGTVGHMLELDDILRKAAECTADAEWADWRNAA